MNLVAETTYGRVEGREKDGALLFAGIPYAAPPIGSLRFRATAPHSGWTELRDARKFGPAAPQMPTGILSDPVATRWDEDCLFLNIATPALDNNARPVLVWIHGGAYRTGQGGVPWYNGARFAANGDIVVVSINYRLGALGFTDLSRFGPEFATSGVNGIVDQITALEWVRDNIANFGGDPMRVTIAGESAGGFSVTTLLSSPRAAGLFHRAIPQSGAGHHALPPTAGAEVADAFLRELDGDNAMHVEAAAAEDVLAAQTRTIQAIEADRGAGSKNALGAYVQPFYPVYGNDVVPDLPIDSIRNGAGSDVALLIGSNLDEATLWAHTGLAQSVEGIAEHYGDPKLADVYRHSRPDATDQDLKVAISTDHMFGIPAIRVAEARAQEAANTWVYRFDWKSRAFEGRLGATHSLEIPFAFDNLDKPGVELFIGPGPLPQTVADTMHAAWTAFIREGEPGWQPYDLQTRTAMIFDDQSQTQDDPASNEREAWDGLR